MLTSDRLTLRAVEPEDADFMHDAENDRRLWSYSRRIAPLSKEQLRTYAYTYDADPLRAGQLRLIIERHDVERPVGIIDLFEIDTLDRRAYLGIVVSERYRRTGIAAEALEMIERYASQCLGLHQLAAKISTTNAASLALFAKAGYREAGMLRDWILEDGEWQSVAILQKII